MGTMNTSSDSAPATANMLNTSSKLTASTSQPPMMGAKIVTGAISVFAKPM